MRNTSGGSELDGFEALVVLPVLVPLGVFDDIGFEVRAGVDVVDALTGAGLVAVEDIDDCAKTLGNASADRKNDNKREKWDMFFS